MYLQKGICIKTYRKNYFLLASWRVLTKRAGSGAGSVSQRWGSEDPHPDPYQDVTDPDTLVKTRLHHNSVGSASACCYGRPEFWARICKPYMEPRNQFPARRAGTTNPFDVPACQATQAGGLVRQNMVVVPSRQAGNRFLGSLKGLQIRACSRLGIELTGDEKMDLGEWRWTNVL